MPGCIVSATTASFRSVEKRRRRATPVITSTFENVSDIGVCLGLYLGPPARAGVRSKRGAVHCARRPRAPKRLYGKPPASSSTWFRPSSAGAISPMPDTIPPSIPSKITPDPLQFVITSMLISIPKSDRVRTFNFIRRSSNALAEYRHARRAYHRFFDNRLPQLYLEALHHFESCFACAYQGHELLFGMTNRPFFDKGISGPAELN